MTARVWSGILGAAVLLLIAAPGTLVAQGPPGGGGPSANVTVAPPDILFPAPAQLDFEAGWVEHGGVSITIEPRNKNRQNWQLFVQASAADMGGYGKPVNDILVRVQGSASWAPLGTTAQLLAEGSGATTVTVYYRLALDWTLDAPGTYSVPIEYTSTSF
ncbi:MAG: hypothetical protein R6U63_09275 [Longimicrobiales bacterium]